MKTTITSDCDGWTRIAFGLLEIRVPTDLDESGADERVEVCCNGLRVFVEATDDGLSVSPVERVQDMVGEPGTQWGGVPRGCLSEDWSPRPRKRKT